MARLNLTLTDELKKYIEEFSSEIGISQNAFICMALKEYMDNKKMVALIDLELIKREKAELLKKGVNI